MKVANYSVSFLHFGLHSDVAALAISTLKYWIFTIEYPKSAKVVASTMSTSPSPKQRSQASTSPTLVALLAILFAPHLVHAATQITFFEHSSCNAGTSFAEYNDAGTLQSDTSCHQTPNGTVALYVNGIDSGCTCMSNVLILFLWFPPHPIPCATTY